MATETRRVPRWVPILIVVAIGLIIAFVAIIAAGVMMIFSAAKHTPQHLCAVQLASRSPMVLVRTGKPISESALGTFNTSSDNDVTTFSETFTLTGPKGNVEIQDKGQMSDSTSSIAVNAVWDGQASSIYSGKVDCPAIHETKT
jgi:hypothetical protein